MTATVATVAYLGLEARAVEVQVQLSSGIPAFVIVGLPDKAGSRLWSTARSSANGSPLSAAATPAPESPTCCASSRCA
jgi:hypothetical protein